MNLDVRIARRLLVGLLLAACPMPVPTAVATQTNLTFRIMAANLTSGNSQSYETAGLNIFKGLKPDVVAIQEFRYANNTPADFRAMLDTAFGTNFVYYRESGYNIPNGIISRFPILAAGSWDDPLLSDRSFAWAQLGLPGSNDLYVVSVHLYNSGSASERNTEATLIKSNIVASFPANAWVVVAGDFNTDARTEAAVTTFKTFLSDNPIPTDAESGGDMDTNEPRNKPYDYVLPSLSFVTNLVPTVLPSHVFANGLVFDSAVYTPLSDVTPVASGDSHVSGMQHMGVIKDFRITYTITNAASDAPQITTQPQSQSVSAGATVGFSVTSTGTSPLAYQWRFNGADLSGASASALTLTNVQTTDAGSYAVVITNVAGAITSDVAVLTVATAQSGIIAQWDFNSPTPDGTTTTGTLAPSTGSGTATYIGGTAAASSGEFAGGSSTDPNASDNSGWNTSYYPVGTVGNKTAGVKFAVSTAGRENISIRWDQRESSTGSKYVRLRYSTNGSDFIDFPTAVSVAGTSFEPKTNSLAGFPGANNNSDFAFQIVAEFESTATGAGNSNYVGATGTYGTGGTVRFDMVTVSGTAIPAATCPSITCHPASQIAQQGADATFSVQATGTAPLTYQWRFDSSILPGATASAYTRTNVQPADMGSYSVAVANSAGTVTSATATLSLRVPAPSLVIPSPEVVEWEGLSNLTYTVQAKTNLGQSNWITLGTASSPRASVSFTNQANAPQRFYRVVYP